MNVKTYCFVAGVSGGHILPALNLAHHYQKQDPHARIIFITTQNDLDTTVMRDTSDIEHHSMHLKPVPYRMWYKLPQFTYQLLSTFVKSIRIFLREKPKSVITTGSHLALPVCVAAWILRIPIELVALDIEPGRTLIALAPLATTISICFKEAQQYFPRKQCVVCPYPLSKTIHSLTETREELLEELGFDSDKKTILIVGGSQGSVSLNNAVKTLLNAYPDAARTLQFIHQTGSSDATDWQSVYAAHGITAHAFAYNPKLVRYYIAADCIITRAGSGSLHEIMHLKKQCIIIPLITSTTHHQRANAHAMKERHPELVQVIEQEALNKDTNQLMHAIQSAHNR
jgi:UDP-N-acetylglucosamine--N-acetylmuramyl-(pentapeptide) pyrophosphoryl-undecaprenol N-acetylglucosamine transferase